DQLWHAIRADELNQLGNTTQRFRDAFLTYSHLFIDDGSKGVPIRGVVPTTVLIAMGMAVLMALMSCTNVAGLLLVRVAKRTREISVRYALGAQRGRLLQQLFSEGVLLGIGGGAIGILLAPQIAAVCIRAIWGGRGQYAFSPNPDIRILT